MPSKIVLMSPSQEVTQIARTMLPQGFDQVEVPGQGPQLEAALADADFFVGLGGGGESFFAAGRKLKLVQLLSAGYDRWDLAAARKAGVPIANNGGANAVAVAEHALLLMLATHRKLVEQHRNVVSGRWRGADFTAFRIYELEGRKLGIIGLGMIGKKVARRAAAFGMPIQYYDIARLTEDQEDALGVRFALLRELLQTSDVITIHVPLNDGTRDMIGDAELALMKPSAVLINTARGPIVNEPALHRALTSGTIAAAGLDVLVDEPPQQDHPLFTLENVVLTPHMAGPTWDNWVDRLRNAYDNVQRVDRGEPPLWVVPELQG